jgi:putative tryptophan/tyrosine transport system substrate-binding protein
MVGEPQCPHRLYRFAAGSADRFEPLAKELVALPDAILAQSTRGRHPPSSVPIVFVAVSDPIGSGFAEELPRRLAPPSLLVIAGEVH